MHFRLMSSFAVLALSQGIVVWLEMLTAATSAVALYFCSVGPRLALERQAGA